MGVKVRFKKYVPRSNTAATWSEEGPEIEIFQSRYWSKIDIIMSLIHELGHHKDFVYKGRKTDYRADKALQKENPNKKQRFAILKTEIDGTKYWEGIYLDVGCSFPIDLVYRYMEKDIWYYQYFYMNGKNPTAKMSRKKDKQLKRKHGI